VLRTIDSVRVTRIEKVVQESANIRSLIFDDNMCLSALPGQFVMVWLPDVGEFPMSVSLLYGKKSSIVVKPMGEGSRSLYNCKEGDFIGIRGPYGSNFTIPKGAGRLLLIGGGTGIAPILKLVEEANRIRIKQLKVQVVVGARTRDELSFLPILKKFLNSKNVYPTTDDGTLGYKGFAHEKVNDLCERFEYDTIYCCGPEAMMLRVFDIATKRKIRAQISLERIMKCGIGICGSCCIEDIVLCRDGPVLDDKIVRELSREFGKFERDKTGALTKKS